MPTIRTEKLEGILELLAHERKDEEAWKLLYTLMWPLVFATSYRYLRGEPDLTADAAQEVFFRLYKYVDFEEFADRPESFTRYLSAMAKNVSRKYVSRILREPLLSEPEFEKNLMEFEEERSSGIDSPESAAIRDSEVSAFLSSLDPDNRKLADLLLEGADTSKVAESLGLTYANAAVRIHRLRELARNSMKTG